MTDLERFQEIKTKVDANNTQIIEKELKIKALTEDNQKYLKDLEDLGYKSLEDAKKDSEVLSAEVEAGLTKMEEDLNGVVA